MSPTPFRGDLESYSHSVDFEIHSIFHRCRTNPIGKEIELKSPIHLAVSKVNPTPAEFRAKERPEDTELTDSPKTVR